MMTTITEVLHRAESLKKKSVAQETLKVVGFIKVSINRYLHTQ